MTCYNSCADTGGAVPWRGLEEGTAVGEGSSHQVAVVVPPPSRDRRYGTNAGTRASLQMVPERTMGELGGCPVLTGQRTAVGIEGGRR